MNNYFTLYRRTTNEPLEVEALALLTDSIYKHEKEKATPIFLKQLLDDDRGIEQYIKQFTSKIGWKGEPVYSNEFFKEGIRHAAEKQISSEELITIEQFTSLKEAMLYDISSRNSGYSIVPSFIYELLIQLIKPNAKGRFLNSYAENISVLDLMVKNEIADKYLEIPNNKIAFNFYLYTFLFNLNQSEFRIGDPLLEPPFVESNEMMKFDAVVSAPPFDWFYDEDYISSDVYNRFNRADIGRRDSTTAHILHVLAHLNKKGKAAILVHGSPLFQTGRRATAREYLLNNDYVEGVIALSSGLLRNTSIPVFILVLNRVKNAALKNKVIFFDATGHSEVEHRNRKLTEKNLENIVETYNQASKQENVAIVDVQQVLENESNLNPVRYITDSNIFIEGYGSATIDENKYKDIQTQNLEEICEVITGGNIKKSESGDKVKTINGKALQNEKVSIAEIEELTIVNKETIQRSIIKPNDILMLSRGATPKFAIAGDYFAQEEVYATTNLFILRPKKNVSPAYILSYLNSPFGIIELSKVQKGTTIPMFTAKAIKQLPIPIVDVSNQEIIQETYSNAKQRYEEAMKLAEQELADSTIHIYEKMGLMKTINNN